MVIVVCGAARLDLLVFYYQLFQHSSDRYLRLFTAGFVAKMRKLFGSKKNLHKMSVVDESTQL